uniref:Rad50 zinc hook motif n=1 Tax=Podoviridae sp. ct8dV2 TaxID=2825222 RepID=A0A8S5PPT2_9CAUD|nr:MAG TPA: Rad50 zinc hook motif [Podoviridae sp. ct8dV2]
MDYPKVDLQPGDICPCCGQMIRRKSEAQATASRENGKKGGRPKGSKNKPKN